MPEKLRCWHSIDLPSPKHKFHNNLKQERLLVKFQHAQILRQIPSTIVLLLIQYRIFEEIVQNLVCQYTPVKFANWIQFDHKHRLGLKDRSARNRFGRIHWRP